MYISHVYNVVLCYNANTYKTSLYRSTLCKVMACASKHSTKLKKARSTMNCVHACAIAVLIRIHYVVLCTMSNYRHRLFRCALWMSSSTSRRYDKHKMISTSQQQLINTFENEAVLACIRTHAC
jgi:hypothetical protein